MYSYSYSFSATTSSFFFDYYPIVGQKKEMECNFIYQKINWIGRIFRIAELSDNLFAPTGDKT